MKLSLSVILSAAGGDLVLGEPSIIKYSFNTDTRAILPGEIFIALKGANFDGAQFAHDAFEKGAAGIIASALPQGTNIPDGRFYIKVENAEKALGDLAAYMRRQSKAKVMIVMGSAGKTTSKEMISLCFSPALNLLCTHGNLNNLIGVPLTLFRLEPQTQMVVAEIGMNTSGEIRRLSEITNPDYLVVTNIGRAHIGMFGSQAELIRAKAEVFDEIRPECLLILNADCPRMPRFLSYVRHAHQKITYGIERDAEVMAKRIQPLEHQGYRFDVFIHGEKAAHVSLPVFGRHNIYNALAAAASAFALGLDVKAACAELENFKPAWMRSAVYEKKGIRIISDCYNANPDSVALALRSLVDEGKNRRLFIVLGDMLELGEDAQQFHREVGRVAAELRPAMLLTFGEIAHFISDEASRSGIKANHLQSHDDICRLLLKNLREGDTLLIKGSRMMKLETVTEKILKTLSGNKETLGE